MRNFNTFTGLIRLRKFRVSLLNNAAKEKMLNAADSI